MAKNTIPGRRVPTWHANHNLVPSARLEGLGGSVVDGDPYMYLVVDY